MLLYKKTLLYSKYVQRIENNEQRAKNNKRQEDKEKRKKMMKSKSCRLCCVTYKEKINDEIQALSFIIIIIIIV